MSDEEVVKRAEETGIMIANSTVDSWWDAMKLKYPQFANDDPQPWKSGYISGLTEGVIGVMLVVAKIESQDIPLSLETLLKNPGSN